MGRDAMFYTSAALCGQSGPNRVYTADAGVMVAIFKSDNETEGTGFSLRFEKQSSPNVTTTVATETTTSISTTTTGTSSTSTSPTPTMVTTIMTTVAITTRKKDKHYDRNRDYKHDPADYYNVN